MEELDVRYGEALFLASKDLNKLDEFYEQLTEVKEILTKEKELIKLLNHPNIEKEERKSIIEKIFHGKIEKELINFFKILIDKNRITHFSAMIDAFSDMYYEEKGILRVKVISAYELEEEQKEKLAENLKAEFNKEISLVEEIDESIIGGLLLETEGKVLDGTVKSKLENIRQVLVSI